MDTSFFEQRVGEELDFLCRNKPYKFIWVNISVDVYREYALQCILKRVSDGEEFGYEELFPKNFDFSKASEVGAIARRVVDTLVPCLEGENA